MLHGQLHMLPHWDLQIQLAASSSNSALTQGQPVPPLNLCYTDLHWHKANQSHPSTYVTLTQGQPVPPSTYDVTLTQGQSVPPLNLWCYTDKGPTSPTPQPVMLYRHRANQSHPSTYDAIQAQGQPVPPLNLWCQVCSRAATWSTNFQVTGISQSAKLMLFVGCLMSQQHASVPRGRICSDKFTCCHTEIEVAGQTFHLT